MPSTTKELKNTSCECCAKGSFTYLWTKNCFDTYQCDSCGLVFLHPGPSMEQIDAFYNQQALVDAKAKKLDLVLLDISLYRRHLLNIFDRFRKSNRILDVGCYKGFFVLAAKNRKWDARGIEISSLAADYGKKHLHVDVDVGDFLTHPYKKGSFDVITLFDLIEHVPDPGKFITRCRELLRPGGCLYLYTPNYDSIPRYLLGKEWEKFIPVHLYSFSPKTMRKMLTQNGFSVESLVTSEMGSLRKGGFDIDKKYKLKKPSLFMKLMYTNKTTALFLLRLYYFYKWVSRLFFTSFSKLGLHLGGGMEIIAVKK